MAIQRVTDDVDPEKFFRRGESFFFAADYLWRAGLEVMGPASFAQTTCMAFAAEVYLKVLVLIEKGLSPLDTHNLKELFNDLVPATQRETRRLWLRANKHMLNLKLPDPRFKSPKTFEEALDLSAKAFIAWRYDEKGVSHWHMAGLLPILRERILTAKQDWRPPHHSALCALNPHPDFVKPKDEHVAAFVLPPGFNILNRKASPLKVKIGRSSNPKDRGSG